MDRETWRAAVHWDAKNQTRLSDWTEMNWKECMFQCYSLLETYLWQRRQEYTMEKKNGLFDKQYLKNCTAMYKRMKLEYFFSLSFFLFYCSGLLNTISSVQFNRSVVAASLQHARPPCPSPTPGVYSNSCPSSRWCIQPSHPLSSPSPPATNPSQHQGLFQWVNSLHQVAKVLEFQLQHQSFQWTHRTDLL